ncbi:helix-turn-helix domain-containing protein [Magnetospirillum aberrantis]|uniref:Helix-turn-helix transcriptional regulator n=1 Tax=Magnetospirillum aberrantis SpK TaxID=908842 RepID=A0A7C9QTC5_9PROT|nr:helix-turn-helix transcriptional regulator [Magnetospirillum aberrantis]NFV79982.1 helix-turn-helix transcriptional regulator [Magnetospirillum aberrantis SpK]
MTAFALLLSLVGLSHREAANFVGVSIDSVRGWINGRRTPPAAVLDELRAMIAAQELAAAEALELITEQYEEALGAGRKLTAIDLGYPADDAEATLLGLPCVSAWRMMAARVVAKSPVPVRLIPRSSTLATAGAAEAHGK